MKLFFFKSPSFSHRWKQFSQNRKFCWHGWMGKAASIVAAFNAVVHFRWIVRHCNKIYVWFVYNWISKQVSTNQSSTKTSCDFRRPIIFVPAAQFCWHYEKNWEFHNKTKNKVVGFLPDKTWSSIFDNLFLVKMSLTIRVILEKAPFWMSVIKLFVKLTDSSLVWVEKTRGVSRSGKKRRKKNC